MLRLVKRYADALIFSNIFISIGAVSQTVLLYKWLGLPIQTLILAIVGIGTFLMYNWYPVLISNNDSAITNKQYWLFKHKRSISILFVIGAIALLLLLISLNRSFQLYFIILSLVGVLYYIPCIPTSGGIISIRDIPFVKIFFIATIWVTTTVLIPLISIGQYYHPSQVLLIAIHRFLLIIAITIPFDIKDLSADSQNEIVTIPTATSVLFSKRLAILLYIVCFVPMFGFAEYTISNAFTLGIGIVFLLFDFTEQYCYWAIDGILLIQALFSL